MNRRGFLKASAALISAPALPSLPVTWGQHHQANVLFIDELCQADWAVQLRAFMALHAKLPLPEHII